MRVNFKSKLAVILSVSLVSTMLPNIGVKAASLQSVNDSKIIARFDFDNATDGFKSGNVVARNYGVTLSEDSATGKAASFNGKSFLKIENANGSSLLTGKSAITINYMRKCNSGGVGWTFYAAPNESTQTYKNEHYVGVLDNNTSISVERFNNFGSRGTSLVVKGGYSSWNMVTVVLDNTQTKVYVNGKLQDSLANQTKLTDILGSNSLIYVGKANWKEGEYLNGLIDNYTIIDGTLSEEQISRLYQEEMSLISNKQEQDKRDMVDRDYEALSIPNQYNIKGNITLPSVGKNGSYITWTSSDTNVISDKDISRNGYVMPAGVVNRQNEDKKVRLTATISGNGKSRNKVFTVRVRAKKTMDKTTDYLFAYFTGNTVAGENIYFATSRNGLNYLEVNNKKPVLTSFLGEMGLRDPYIFRSYEGDKYYIIATDLSIGRNSSWPRAREAGSQAIMVWESDDLVHWSDQRMAIVSDKIGAGCTWAPEAYYDVTTGEYIVFWASEVSSDNFALQRIYYSKTRDFVTFTDPQPWIDRRTANTIDTTVVSGADGYLYRISKNEGNGTLPDGTKITGATVYMEKSKTMLGNWTRVYAPTLEKINRVEGPCIFRLNDDDASTPTWCTLLDHYGNGGYRAYLTSDLVANRSEAVFKSASNASLPTVPRHGTVMQLTSAEYQKVMDYYYYNKDVPVDSDNYVSDDYDDSNQEENEVIAPGQSVEAQGYLLAYTNSKESAALGNSLHLAVSYDGKNYEALNSNTGICFANNKGGKKNVNPNSLGAPFVFRKADGTYGLLAYNATTSGSYIYAFDSKDLISFTNERKISVTATVTDIAGCVYSDAKKTYEIYWKSGNTTYMTTSSDLKNASGTSSTGADISKLRGNISYINTPQGAVVSNVIGVSKEVLTKVVNKLGTVKNTGIDAVEVTAKDMNDLVLPDKVTANYSDGSTTQFGVSWNMAGVDLSKKGTYEIEGTIKQTKYLNPLITQRADPCILKGNDGYYYFTASYPMLGSSDRNGYDKIVLRRAKTIEGLSTAQEVTIWDCDNCASENRYVWAPEIHCINGTYYIFYTSSIQSNNVWGIRPHVLKCNNSANIMSSSAWETKGVMQASGSDKTSFGNFSLDMTLFENKGRYYVMWAQTDGFSSIFIAEVDKNAPWKCISNATKISVPEYSWERVVENVNEGPNIIKNNGKLYCTFSAAGTGVEYCIGLLTADENANLLQASSWVKQPYPVLTSADVPGEYGPGHNSFTTDLDGNAVFVYHARGNACYKKQCAWSNTGSLYDPCRDARVKRVHWAADGSPILKMNYEEELRTTSVKATVIIGEDMTEVSSSEVPSSEVPSSEVSSSEVPSSEVPGSEKYQPLIKDGWYYIRNVNANKYLTVEGNKNQAGTNVCIYEKTGAEGQKWKLTTLSNGNVTLTSGLGAFMMDIARGEDTDGANIGIYHGYSGEAQQFVLKKVEGSNAVFLFTAVSNGTKVIDVNGKGKTNGTNVIQWTLNSKANQQFIFETMDGQIVTPVVEKVPTTQPRTEVPTTQPKTEVPTTQPRTEVPTTQPKTEVPTTQPRTEVPTTQPRTEVPTTQPRTEVPTTQPRTEVPTTAPQQTSGLKVDYTINSWGSGYQVNFKISNTGANVNTWTLRVSKSDINIASSWNVNVQSVGNEYVITPVAWNSSIAKGGSIEFGILGNGTVGSTINCSVK